MKVKNLLITIIVLLLFSSVSYANDLTDIALITSDSCRTCVSFESKNSNILQDIKRITIEEEKGIEIYKSDKLKDIKVTIPYLRDMKTGVVIAEKDNIVAHLSGEEYKEVDNINKSLMFITITSALVDSFNPCSLFALIYIISVLSSINSTKRRLLQYVLVYVVTVFIVYTGIGYISLEILKRVINLQFFVKITGVSMLIITVLLLIMTLRNNNKSYKEPSEIVSDYFEKHKWSTGITVVVLAIVLSVTEFACTGQIYIPTLMVMGSSGLKNVYTYLLLYNLIFITPIILVGTSYILLSDKASAIMVFLLNSKKKAKMFSIMFYIVLIVYIIYKYLI